MNSRPLTILHVNTERGWRGGERQTLWLAQGIARAGHRSMMVVRPGRPLAARSMEAGLETVFCSPGSELDLAAARFVRRCILANEVDVVHAHTAHAVALAALAARRTPACMVLTRRVGFPLRSNPFTRWKYRRADGVIAISSRVERSLVEGGIDPAIIEVIPSGVPLRREVAPAPRSELGVADDAPLVVMVGALTHEKDPVTFVRAVAAAHRRVPHLRALLVGDGPLRSEVQAEAARLGIANVLRLTGQRDDADALIAASDLVVLSSVEEGLGSVLLDAMAFAKPVAATSAGGIPEIVVNDETGLLVEPRDGEALGEAIARIVGDAELSARLGAGARARASRFSIENTVARTVAVYERVLSAATPRPGAR
jgi:glycosyltransferase involved in cell wall biosynthesis